MCKFSSKSGGVPFQPLGDLTWNDPEMVGQTLDWRQCGNSLALCYFAVVIELPDSLWMNCKSEFGVIFLRCSPT